MFFCLEQKSRQNKQPKENNAKISHQGRQAPRQNFANPLSEAFKLWQHALKMVQQYAQARGNDGEATGRDRTERPVKRFGKW